MIAAAAPAPAVAAAPAAPVVPPPPPVTHELLDATAATLAGASVTGAVDVAVAPAVVVATGSDPVAIDLTGAVVAPPVALAVAVVEHDGELAYADPADAQHRLAFAASPRVAPTAPTAGGDDAAAETESTEAGRFGDTFGRDRLSLRRRDRLL